MASTALDLAVRPDGTPFTIYADEDASHPSTPNDIFPFSPEVSSKAHVIEEDSSLLSDRRISTNTNTTSISSFPASLPPDKPYVLHNPRTVFRSPSTYPTLQMTGSPSVDSPGSTKSYLTNTSRRRGAHPFDADPTSPLSHRTHSTLSTSTRPSGTPSRSQRSSTPSTTYAAPAQPPPLVLLHVTLLPPSRQPYAAALLAAVGAPPAVAANQRLLAAALTDTVRARGLLVAHPGAEYDLLEERLLEGLELCAPRVLRCGHFYGRGEGLDGADGVSEGSACEGEEGASVGETVMDGDEDVCPDCDGHISLPWKGAGTGSRRFDVKIYAANGLMRAGAWSAAWKEMERVDVEIDVWIPEDIRKLLDEELRKEEEEVEKCRQEEDNMIRRADEEIEALSRAHEEAIAAREDAQRARMRADEHAAQLQREVNRLLAASADSTPTPLPQLAFHNDATVKSHRSSSGEPRRLSSPHDDASLGDLARKAFVIVSRDPKNIALFGLSLIVLLLSLSIGSRQATPAPLSAVHQPAALSHCVTSSIGMATPVLAPAPAPAPPSPRQADTAPPASVAVSDPHQPAQQPPTEPTASSSPT